MGTIFVAGIYGVGKSTLCDTLSKELKIPAYSAGDLISSVNGERYGANKAVTDKISNQVILSMQVQKLLEVTPQILLAGHFCIFDKNNGVDYLPEIIFSDLNIERILLLEAPVSTILRNLSLRDKKSIHSNKFCPYIMQRAKERGKYLITSDVNCIYTG